MLVFLWIFIRKLAKLGCNKWNNELVFAAQQGLTAAMTAFICWFLISVQLTSKPTTFAFLAWWSAKMNLLWPQGRSVSKNLVQVWGEKLGVPWMLKLETLRRNLVTNWYFYLNSGWFRCQYHWSLHCPPCKRIYFGLLFFSWCRWYSPFPVKHDVLGSNFQAV